MSQQLELLTENPSQWAATVYVAPQLQKKEIKPFVILAVKELEGKPDSRISSIVCMDKFAAVRAVVRHVARARSATKVPWSKDDVRMFLEGLRFSPDCITELTTLLCTEQMYENIPRHVTVKPGLQSLQWKIDLSLCQSNLTTDMGLEEKRQLMHRHTYVILILTLTNDERLTYRLTVTKFHELRYTIANALKSMIVLEKRNCMRKD